MVKRGWEPPAQARCEMPPLKPHGYEQIGACLLAGGPDSRKV